MCEDTSGNRIAEGGPDRPTRPFLSPAVVDGYNNPFPLLVPDPFTLPFNEPLATKRIFYNRWTILPCELANLPCTTIKPRILLSWLNTIFCTHFPCTVAVEECLSEFIDDGCDLGQAYGYLRPWWPGFTCEEDFSSFPTIMRDCRQNDYKLRSSAITTNHITKSDIPPRRVWDLYANRVLPYHAMKPQADHRGEPQLPENLWAVSHSWRPAFERQAVLTTINGRAWRVPIPRGTTLNEIRNELLILGAEYVFLDVLCLRQKDELLPEMESVRKKEWRLDIPTIGYVYNENINRRPVIVYFTGLGLRLRRGPVDPNDQFHWFNRVWTLQEIPIWIILGGLERKQEVMNIFDLIEVDAALPSVGRAIFEQLCKSIQITADFQGAIEATSSRTCTNPVDEVACLAYLLRCKILPIYDADMDVEVAWRLLVECLPERTRTSLLLSDYGTMKTGSWCPTWKQVKNCRRSINPYDLPDRQHLIHLDGSSPSSGYRHGFDAYYHDAHVIERCRIHVPPLPGRLDQLVSIDISSPDGANFTTNEVITLTEDFEPDIEYLLVGVGQVNIWVVAKAAGFRRVNGNRALEALKVSTLRIERHHPMPWDTIIFRRKMRAVTQLVVWR